MIKIIFLDIDGVLNVYCEGRDEYGCTFHKHFEENLASLIKKTGAKIVVTSTWRSRGLLVMKEIWEKRSLAGEVIDITPHIDIGKRGEEIQQWMENNKVDRYVIIDDDTDILESQKRNFVQTSDNPDHKDCIDIGYGLTKICTEKAIIILNT